MRSPMPTSAPVTSSARESCSVGSRPSIPTSPTPVGASGPCADPRTLPLVTDRGLTHIALTVRDADASSAFYARYGGFDVVHRRSDPDTGRQVVWLTDHTRPFVIVLIEVPQPAFPLAG